ncbi:MAG TPA: 50S ribosomal protein L10 [Candidatus Nanopusillus sp.]|nr:50S ribosomal protein L10 [Candidatus Nanopusillus sp.]
MVAPWKVEYVNNLVEELKKSSTFAIANAMDIPSRSMQQIRKSLKQNNVYVKVVKKTLLIKALDKLVQENPKYREIMEFLEKQKRITITLLIPREDMNPFKLYRILEENKSYRAARPGDIAPNDIVIPSGPTPFTPGPILSTLKKFNLKTKVEGGKIVITEDKIVAKKGEEVTFEIADLLNKFGIEPIEVKLNIVLAYDKGIIYTEDILSIPPEKYIEDLQGAFRKAVALSLEIVLPTKYSKELLLKRAFENAVKLSLKTGIPSKDTIKPMLKRLIATAVAAAQYLPEDVRPIKIQMEQTQIQEEKREEKSKEEEDKKDEQALEGLGSLFGF